MQKKFQQMLFFETLKNDNRSPYTVLSVVKLMARILEGLLSSNQLII